MSTAGNRNCRTRHLFVALGVFGFGLASTTASGELVFKGGEIKSLREDHLYRATFTFENVGDVDVAILDIKVPCECIRTVATPTRPAPGARGEIILLFPSYAGAGAEHFEITVMTDELPGVYKLRVGSREKASAMIDTAKPD